MSAKVDCKDAIEIDRFQSVGKAGMIPMVAIFLSGRVLLWREGIRDLVLTINHPM
jgi:hypothetical protein